MKVKRKVLSVSVQVLWYWRIEPKWPRVARKKQIGVRITKHFCKIELYQKIKPEVIDLDIDGNKLSGPFFNIYPVKNWQDLSSINHKITP